ncbi:hypothetical protein D6R50_06505 [Aeromonas veronii]|uniref:Phage protein n=1 Tax=Aeromonas veronii TaxID=654 RepID=A0A3A9IYY9_AERVE|nr:hypothetical protein [Aeromonas veronii]RKJ84408.1 hypothetical protein D6R50_22390 [Aeromonas veronii]RKJ89965.1 hypothetical protein D6R50_12180 [Aeromonas veronii]RKJ92194.1 hypothetical protein D6R50_06505 [Aeromonas veronii]
MKLMTRASIEGHAVQLVSHDIVLDLNAGGRAIVNVSGQVTKGQMITLDVGYNSELRRYFDGYVFDVQPAKGNTLQVLCRERAGVLAARFPVSQQHATLRSLLAWLTDQTGLVFMLPQAEYVDTPIPNFTSSGSGYQLLDNAGRAFGIPDFVWYQEPAGSIFVGSHADSRWHGRDMPLDPAWSGRQAGNLMVLPVLPAMRPGATINGKRVTRVRIKDDEMTLTTATAGKVVKSPARANIESEFPELADGMHLPKFGRVEAISDHASAGQRNDPFRPRYAVDVQLLGEDGEPDALTPRYRAVPLPVAFGGPEQGLLQYPLEGTLVELGFAFGRADRPFIRTILGTGWPLPDIAPGEQLQQQRKEVFSHTDTVGNQARHTDRRQHDRALQMHRQADEYLGEFGQHRITTQQHSIEEVGAMKRIEALGAIELLAGDEMVLGCLGNMSQTAAGDLTEVVGLMRRAIAGELQHLEAPRSWMGTDSVNIFRLLLQLINVVAQLAATTASHTHGSGPAPDNSAAMTSHGQEAGQLASQLSPIIE